MEKDRFFAMYDLFCLLHDYYNLNDDNVIEYLQTKKTYEIEDIITQIEKGGECEEKFLKDFRIWEDKNIIQEELCKLIIDITECNSTDVLYFVHSLDIEDRFYFYNYCTEDMICEEFERWRSKNELSQNS